MTLDFPFSRAVKNKCVLLKPPSLWNCVTAAKADRDKQAHLRGPRCLSHHDHLLAQWPCARASLDSPATSVPAHTPDCQQVSDPIFRACFLGPLQYPLLWVEIPRKEILRLRFESRSCIGKYSWIPNLLRSKGIRTRQRGKLSTSRSTEAGMALQRHPESKEGTRPLYFCIKASQDAGEDEAGEGR